MLKPQDSICWECTNARAGFCAKFETPNEILPIWDEYEEKVIAFQSGPTVTYVVKACKKYIRDVRKKVKA